MGMFLAAGGAGQAGFGQLLDLLRHGEGRTWVKLTGTYRISTVAGFADVDSMVAALIAAAPDRLIWGSDYPHLSFADKVGTVALFTCSTAGRRTHRRSRKFWSRIRPGCSGSEQRHSGEVLTPFRPVAASATVAASAFVFQSMRAPECACR